jgi:molybdate transport system permease protein
MSDAGLITDLWADHWANLWPVLWLTLRCASLAVLLLLPPGLALAWLLARREWPGKSMVETLISLPLVMPPVATGLLLLRLLGRHGPLGQLLAAVDLDVIFTWRAVVVAMAVMSLPLFVRSARLAFAGVDQRLEQVARTLGASPWRVARTITLPLALPGLVGGLLLAFARAIGEFGATILVAGSIPGRTTTLATAIYQHVQLGEDPAAYRLVGVAAVIAFAAVWTSEAFLRRRRAAPDSATPAQ